MVMDEDIREALRDLKQDLRDGFKDVNTKFDGLVTKAELAAELKGRDEKIEGLVKTVDDHIKSSPAMLENVRTEMDTELERFRASQRWAIGISVTISGLVFGIISYLTNGNVGA